MKKLIALLTTAFIITACSNKTENQTNPKASEENKSEIAKILPPSMSNLPYEIPFEASNKPKAFEIKSITATGKKNGGYALTIKCKALKSVKSGDPSGFKSLTLKQKDKGNPNAHTPAAYQTPPFDKGEEFDFEIVNLFDGYFNPGKFDSFVVEY